MRLNGGCKKKKKGWNPNFSFFLFFFSNLFSAPLPLSSSPKCGSSPVICSGAFRLFGADIYGWLGLGGNDASARWFARSLGRSLDGCQRWGKGVGAVKKVQNIRDKEAIQPSARYRVATASGRLGVRVRCAPSRRMRAEMRSFGWQSYRFAVHRGSSPSKRVRASLCFALI